MVLSLTATADTLELSGSLSVVCLWLYVRSVDGATKCFDMYLTSTYLEVSGVANGGE